MRGAKCYPNCTGSDRRLTAELSPGMPRPKPPKKGDHLYFVCDVVSKGDALESNKLAKGIPAAACKDLFKVGRGVIAEGVSK